MAEGAAAFSPASASRPPVGEVPMTSDELRRTEMLSEDLRTRSA